MPGMKHKGSLVSSCQSPVNLPMSKNFPSFNSALDPTKEVKASSQNEELKGEAKQLVESGIRKMTVCGSP